jgi:hypothetical protein
MGSPCGLISVIWFTNIGITWSHKTTNNNTFSIQGLIVKLYKELPQIPEFHMRVMSKSASMLSLSSSTLLPPMAVMAPHDQVIDIQNWNVGGLALKAIMWPVYLTL